MSVKHLTPLQMLVLDMFVLLPFGAWMLMLGTPHLGLNISYTSALWAHLCFGGSLSAMRFVVRPETEFRQAMKTS